MKSRIKKCEVCGTSKNLHRAHVIHDGMFDDKKNIMILCQKHHRSFDETMEYLLTRPFYKEWQKKQQFENSTRYRKKFIRRKSFSTRIEPRVCANTDMTYNLKTKHIGFHSSFMIDKQRRGVKKLKSLFSSSFGQPYVVVYDRLTYNKNTDNIRIYHGFTFTEKAIKRWKNNAKRIS